MKSPRLQFWFDFASTYSYVAAMQVEERCRDAGVALEWKAFLLGPIFQLQGWSDSHFNLNRQRGDYMWRDLERLTAKLGIPWRKPSVFPRSSTLAGRIACTIAGEPWCGDFVRRTFVANFGEDRDIGTEETMRGILRELGRDETILERALSDEYRPLLRRNTEEAIGRKIFGAPNFIAAGELFWGEETLDDAIAWLGRH